MNRSTFNITQQNNTEREKVNRRSFLKSTVVTSAAVGIGVLTSHVAAESTVEQVTPVTNLGYRETDHIREYYRLARF